jgi:hypothetical protein
MSIHAIALVLAGGSDRDGFELVRSALLREEDQRELRDEHVARRLTALGQPAAPALLALVEGSGLELLLGDDEAPMLLLCAPDRLGEIALAALTSLPVEVVLATLRAELARAPGPATRALALRVLAAQPSGPGLALALELLRTSELELASPSFREHARAALREPLRHDPRAAAQLESELASLPEGVLTLVVEALSATESEAALDPLEALLGRSPALDLAALDGLARAGEARPWRIGAEVAERLERLSASKEVARRAAATRALGRLGRVDSVTRLVPRLDDPAPQVVAAAIAALPRCAQRTDLADAQAWRVWLKRENEWWKERGEAHVEALQSGDPATLAEHLRELFAHTLARAAAADALLARFEQLEPPELILTCSTLARLSAREAVPDLVPLLDAAEAPVRAAAWKALRSLTGVDLPAERSLWDAYAFE